MDKTARPEGEALDAAIAAAAAGLDAGNPDHFTTDGRPQVKALEAVLGYDISAAERDTAWKAGKADRPTGPVYSPEYLRGVL